jgi:intein/homing endonuclease
LKDKEPATHADKKRKNELDAYGFDPVHLNQLAVGGISSEAASNLRFHLKQKLISEVQKYKDLSYKYSELSQKYKRAKGQCKLNIMLKNVYNRSILISFHHNQKWRNKGLQTMRQRHIPDMR